MPPLLPTCSESLGNHGLCLVLMAKGDVLVSTQGKIINRLPCIRPSKTGPHPLGHVCMKYIQTYGAGRPGALT